MITRRAVGIVVALSVLAALPAVGHGQLPGQERMDVAAVLGSDPLVRGHEVRLAVEFRIVPGYHVNANPPSEDWLIPTVVRVEGIEGVSVERVVYPEAEEGEFDFYSGRLRVYEGSVVAGVVLRVGEAAVLGEATLTVKADYQACDDQVCYAPAEATTLVPVRVEPAGTSQRLIDSPLLERARFEERDGGADS